MEIGERSENNRSQQSRGSMQVAHDKTKISSAIQESDYVSSGAETVQQAVKSVGINKSSDFEYPNDPKR